MQIFKKSLSVFNNIKKVYFWLFNFMIGTETSKFFRFFVHCTTTMLYIFSPFYYYNLIIQLFTMEGRLTIERFGNFILSLLAPIIVICLVKVGMLFTKKMEDLFS